MLPPSVKQILRNIIEMVPQSQLISFLALKLHVRGDFSSLISTRKTVLIVSHTGSRTGAPILSYNLARNFIERYNVVVLFLGPGPLLDACHAVGAIVLGPLMAERATFFANSAIKQITDVVPIDFALVNSIESRNILPALAKYSIPTVSLVHEFAAYTRPTQAFSKTMFWSGQVVFSTEITRDNMLAEYPDLAVREYPIIPQGRCLLPQESDCDAQEVAKEIDRIQEMMRPKNFAPEGIVVLGVGFIQFRKGVDIFLECAARILRKAPNIPFRFIWVGTGYNPEGDVHYSAYLADQINRAALENHVHFMNEVVALDTVYKMADILLLSSRLDPLPNVAIDSLAIGLPVICFDKTTGIADILSSHGLGEACVATYLDTEEMANKAIALAKSKQLRQHVARQGAQMASTVFDMAKYAVRIEQLALEEAERAKQVELDIETIEKSNLLKMSYFHSPDMKNQTRREAIRCYMRSWVSGVIRRKLFPGFHPGIYFEQHGVCDADADPLADYLRAGQPKGPWNFELITSEMKAKPLSPKLRIGLHIHVHYPELFPAIIERLKQNTVRPDLLISVTSESVRVSVIADLETYDGGEVDIRIVPNRGRDIGSFLTEFAETISGQYDLIGHVHTKKSTDMKNESASRRWNDFLLENLLGGQVPMADIILGQMGNEQEIVMVFPDDPHIVGWGKNLPIAQNLSSIVGIQKLYQELCFPIGTMFWARTNALKALFDLNLRWEDYPEEPLPYDGSLLHALERIFGLVATKDGGVISLTNVPEVSR